MHPPTDRILPFQKKPHPATKVASALFYILVGCLIILSYQFSTQEDSPIKKWMAPPNSPHAAYKQKLEIAGLDSTDLGQKWLSISKTSLTDSVHIELPFLAKGYFSADEPQALTYRIKGERGQILKVELSLSGEEYPEVFLDLYRRGRREGSDFERIASADSTTGIYTYQFTRDREYMVRIQPALLQSIGYELKIYKTPSFAFPVDGKDSKAIKSFWGDSRDGGRRSHKGVDIFAKKGTPALAAVNGRVSRVKEGGLGGKVVFLRDEKIPQSLYYAHLDTQMVREGEYVNIGDTLGLVGKTGNARNTPPHLHFGVYQSRIGAVNPFPFLHELDTTVKALDRDTLLVNHWVRTSQRGISVYSSPKTKSQNLLKLSQYFPVKVIRTTQNWSEVNLPNGKRGFVESKYLEGINRRINYLTLEKAEVIKNKQKANAAIVVEIDASSSVNLLAQNDQFFLVETENGTRGWIEK